MIYTKGKGQRKGRQGNEKGGALRTLPLKMLSEETNRRNSERSHTAIPGIHTQHLSLCEHSVTQVQGGWPW